MIRLVTAFILVLSIYGCQVEGRIYSEHQELSPDLEWLSEDTREFKVPIRDKSKLYNLSLSFRYVEGYQYQIAKVKVTETSPSGIERIAEYDLQVRNDNGDYIGDPALDIWDSDHLIEINKEYVEEGVYVYKIAHIMPNDPLYFAMEIGVVLDEAK